MKPNFALDLSHDGIALYRRGRKEWLLVGLVTLDDPEMDSALAVLRRTATGLDQAGLTTQLIIPASQLLAREIYAPEPDRDGYIQAALEGETPYDVADLVYDYTGSSDHVDAVIVARETLDEAEAFATEHGFNPVCFVANAADTVFSREPYFGETRFAATFLQGNAIEPDQTILPFRKDKLAMAEAPRIANEGSETTNSGAPETPDTAANPEKKNTKQPVADGAKAPDAAAKPELTPFVSNRATPPTDEPAKTLDQISPRFGLATTASPAGNAPKIEALPSQPPAKTPDTEGAEPRLTLRATTSDPGLPTQALLAAKAVEQSAVAMPAPSLPAPSLPERDTNFAPVAAKKGGGTGLFGNLAAKTAALLGGMIPAQRPNIIRRATAKDAPPATMPPAAPPMNAAPKNNEAEALTVFGARKGQRGDNSKLGFILTVVLLLILLLIAFGSSYFLSDTIARLWRNDPFVQDVASDQGSDSAEIEAAADAAAIQGFGLGDSGTDDGTQVAALSPETATNSAEIGQDGDSFLPVGPLSGTDAGPQTVQDAEVAYVASGIWQLAPDQSPTPGIETSDDIYVASVDPAVNSFDALALPSVTVNQHDDAPNISNLPLVPGQKFDFDDRGFVRATPDGAVTPEGVRVVAGRPGLRPPERPAETRRDDAAASATVSNTRPKSRPADLSDRIERSTLAGRTLAELGKLKPKPRPQSIQEAARDQAENGQASPGLGDATKLAVLASVKPNARPKNIKAIVAAVISKPVPAAAKATVVPRAASKAPAIPTRASVARSATQRNALRLNAVSLLGVTGKTNSYRALVRLSNGRIKTVEVGDRLDGGRVGSIGKATLSYVKKGRNVVLKMPDEG